MEADKKWVVFGIAVLLVLAGFIAVNKYYFFPQYTVKILAPSPYLPPKDIPDIVLIEPFEGTLRKIIAPDPLEGKDALQAISDREKARNPFLWLGELEPEKVKAPVARAKEIKPVEIPKMGMIIVGEKGNSVMLDRTLVSLGESYGGHVIEDIQSGYIILSGDYGVLRISISERSFGAPKVDILEVNNPNLLINPVVSEKK